MTSHAAAHPTDGHPHHNELHDSLGHHVMDPKTLIAVFVTLLFLTFVTVFVTRFDLGPLNIVVAMGVATIKALLVMLWFMHLKYDKPFNLMIFFASFAFVALFIGFLLMDTGQYQPSIEARQQALKALAPQPAATPAPAPAGEAPAAGGTAPAAPAATPGAAPGSATVPAAPAPATPPAADATAPK